MAFKIGFCAEPCGDTVPSCDVMASGYTEARKSVVQVHFEQRNTTLAYYNDLFDLHVGDLVFVEGKLEGLRGRVSEVSYNFKIRASAYKKVIAVADTHVHGQFFFAGSHFVTFDPHVLPARKAASWFMAPAEDDDYISGSDDTVFCLDDLGSMQISSAAAERGHDYYMENKVRYLCIDGTAGYAIVEGSKPYEVEFEYRGRDIRNLTCSCFCAYNCKHALAAMLQLRETMDIIEKHYASQYEQAGYFAAIFKGSFLSVAIDSRESGSLSL